MKALLRATAILGSSSVINVLVTLVSYKVLAILLGPGGVGQLGLLQGLLSIATMVTGMGIGVGLVRLGASALDEGDTRRMQALRRAAWLLVCLFGCAGALILAIGRVPIGRVMLGTVDTGSAVAYLGIALLFALSADIQTNTLNAFHRIGALAGIRILASSFGALSLLALVWHWRERGLLPAVIASAGISWLVSRWFLARERTEPAPAPTRAELLLAGHSLLRFGAPYTASILVGAGVQQLLPIIVLHVLDAESVGYYRASVLISAGYLGFLLTAMGQDYYPRVSAARSRPADLARLINQQHRLVMLLGVPVILGMLVLAPYVVPIIYSSQFTPMLTMLAWQLIGDLFKLSSWTLAMAILARSDSITYFGTELLAGATLLIASWLGMRWYGLTGLGLGFLATYMLYYAITWLVLRREIGFALMATNGFLVLMTAGAAIVIQSLPLLGLARMQTPAGLLAATLAGATCLRILGADLGLWKRIRARKEQWGV